MDVKLEMIDEGRMDTSKMVIIRFESSFDRQQVLNAIMRNGYNMIPAELLFKGSEKS